MRMADNTKTMLTRREHSHSRTLHAVHEPHEFLLIKAGVYSQPNAMMRIKSKKIRIIHWLRHRSRIPNQWPLRAMY